MRISAIDWLSKIYGDKWKAAQEYGSANKKDTSQTPVKLPTLHSTHIEDIIPTQTILEYMNLWRNLPKNVNQILSNYTQQEK